MRRVLTLTFVSSLLLVLVAAATAAQDNTAENHSDGDHPAAPTSSAVAGATAPSAADETRRAQVLARIGEATVTVGTVEDAINEQSPFVRARYRDPAQLAAFVDSMVRFELLAREADRNGIGDDPEVRRVTQQNAVQNFIRERFDERITVDSIEEEAVRTYYNAHPDEFNRDEIRRASHILFGSEEDANAAMPEIREADARTFRRLAQERSIDEETRLRGGDLRYFERDGASRIENQEPVVRAIAEAAFALNEIGDVSEPVQHGERWSVVKLTGLRQPEHRSIEQAAPSIRLRLWRQRRQSALDAFVAERREAAAVATHYDRLRPIQLDEPEREDQDERRPTKR